MTDKESPDRDSGIELRTDVDNGGFFFESACGGTYSQVQSYCDGEMDCAYVQALVACVDNDPYEVFASDTVAHHATGHPLDNRPEAIEVRERKEHSTIHGKGVWVVEDGEPRLRWCDNVDSDAVDPTKAWWQSDDEEA